MLLDLDHLENLGSKKVMPPSIGINLFLIKSYVCNGVLHWEFIPAL